MRIICRQFLDHLKSNFPDIFSKIETINELIRQFCDNMGNETFKSAVEDPIMINIMAIFEKYLLTK